ncbi:hypothetical protein BpHYR1_019882 [Brachionus plicatilis]|uniref:Uncharacterized protein n=1 Tax=Brachionus plicatilis TaxID=10195 RepID=A0A3M7T8T0_BRAPC|nr:hypothetical protein BpHYR1_019882 [Brachionus plicatilis]
MKPNRQIIFEDKREKTRDFIRFCETLQESDLDLTFVRLTKFVFLAEFNHFRFYIFRTPIASLEFYIVYTLFYHHLIIIYFHYYALVQLYVDCKHIHQNNRVMLYSVVVVSLNILSYD